MSCVIWKMSVCSKGRPLQRCPFTGKRRRAARIALIKKTGIDPQDMEASHTCHNKMCVNPDHLVWETPQENQSRERRKNKGVSWHKRDRKWIARTKINGVPIHIGSFEKEEEAIDAREKYLKSRGL